MALKNDRLIKALLRQPVDKPPVWIMRQAGRYLPEYRKVREQAGSFMTLCQTPELACEVTLQPLRRFDLDAAILFSDILTIPDAMGLGLNFVEGEGPVFEHPVRDQRAIAKLSVPDPADKLRYVTDAIQLVQKSLDSEKPLIGFAGSPWTIATYMVEGSGSKTFGRIKALRYTDPKALHQLLDTLADAIALYLNAQIEAGVNAVMIFDTWGGVLTPDDYQIFSLYYMKKILSQLNRQRGEETIPVTLFTKNAGQWLECIADSGCDAVGIDWMTDMGQAKARIGDRVALQGNLDSGILYASDEAIIAAVNHLKDTMKDAPGHVFNLGHGITPDVNPDKLKVLVDAVHT